jgi:WD40 repeat protein
VILWDAQTWKKITRIKAFNSVRALSFNQDGSLLAIGGDDKKAMLWNIKKDELFKKLSGHDDDVKGIAFSPDGSRVATTSKDKSAIIWDAATGDKIKALNGHTNDVNTVAYSPDGKYLVTGSDDNTIRIWDAATGNAGKSLEGHSDKMSILSFIPGSTILTSGDSVSTAVVVRGAFGIPVAGVGQESACKLIFWNISTAAQLKAVDSDCSLSSLAYSPDGKYLAAGHTGSNSFITVFERK